MVRDMTAASIARVVRMPELRPAKWNPRTIDGASFRRLVRSLERDPGLLWGRPILAMRDGTIYAGNQRYQAALQLGVDWRTRHFGSDGVPAVLEDLMLEAAQERAVRDNSQWGEWVDQDLAEMLTELKARGVDLEILGLTSDELERLLALVTAAAPDDDDFDPAPPMVPQTRAGDLLLLGPNRLVCGDSRKAWTWELLMASVAPDQLADVMWTDPPYGVDLQLRPSEHRMDPDKSRRTTGEAAFEGDRPADLAPLLSGVFPHVDRWLKPGAPFYITGPSGPMERVFLEEIERVGWRLASPGLVWVKNAFVPGRSDYHPQHEMVFYGWKPGAPHVWLRGRSFAAAGRLYGAAVRLRDDEVAYGAKWDAILDGRGSLDKRDPSPEAREFRTIVGNVHLIRALRAEKRMDAELPKQIVQEQIERLVAKTLSIAYGSVVTWSPSELAGMLGRLRSVERQGVSLQRQEHALDDLRPWIMPVG